MAVERRSLNLNSVIGIFEQPAETRRAEEIESIVRFSMLFKFFQEIVERQSSTDTVIEISKHLGLSSYSTGEIVFKSDDPSDCIYFVLKGSVEIFSNTYIDVEEPGDEDLHKLIRKAIDEFIPKSKKNKENVPEIAITKLLPGESFGEMALINEKSRYYTVKSCENTLLGKLHKNDYLKIEGTQEKIISEKMDFLRSIEAFKSWSKISLYKLCFYFKEYKFIKGAVVYNEGDFPNMIFIIKEGEFNFTQKFDIDAGNISMIEKKDSKENTALKSVKNNTIRKKTLQIVTKQAGEIFGYEEILEKIPQRQFTCKCISQVGKLFCISEKNFTKRVTHPETIKIIEEQVKTFQNWAVPRVSQLRELETFKDEASFTPYQKLNIFPRTIKIKNSVNITNYSAIVQENVKLLPKILRKVITDRQNSISASAEKSRHRRYYSKGYSMFATELKSEYRRERHSDVDSSYFINKSDYFPSKLSSIKVKKLKSNLI